MKLSSCGIDCEACRFTVERGCPGCHAVEGKPFWTVKNGVSDGACELYECACGKGLHDCGGCGEFACSMLTEWAYMEEGENGQRIENLKLRG